MHGHLMLHGLVLRLHHGLRCHSTLRLDHATLRLSGIVVHDLLLLGLDGHSKERIDVIRIRQVVEDEVLIE